MSEDIKKMKKADIFISGFSDSTFTIPTDLGGEIYCTINFVRHEMDLAEDDNGQFGGKVSLQKEIIASITMTKKHALEVADIIHEQIKALEDELKK